MTIARLLTYKIIPFEISDEKMKKLFSFFLHSAPTIESRTAMQIDSNRLFNNWGKFIETSRLEPFRIYAESYRDLENACEKEGLGVNTEISKRTKGVICIRKGKENDYECVLRHIRNSIAHNNVCYCNAGNRKFVVFEDYNRNDKLTARILFSQSVLSTLKKEITK